MRVTVFSIRRAYARGFIVENKPGANSSLGVDYVVTSPPDGYTILPGSNSTIGINPAIDPQWISVQTLIPVVKVSRHLGSSSSTRSLASSQCPN